MSSLKRGVEPNFDRPLDAGVEINLHVPALLPEDYVPDVHLRLILYKRLAGCEDEDALRELQVELIDRFGLLPDATKLLIDVTRLKQRAGQLGISKIDAGPASGYLRFAADAAVDPLALVELVQRDPARYKLPDADRLSFSAPMPDGPARVTAVNALLDRLRVST